MPAPRQSAAEILKLRYLALAIGIQFVGQGSSVGTLYNGVPEMTNWNSFFGATKGAQSGASRTATGTLRAQFSRVIKEATLM